MLAVWRIPGNPVSCNFGLRCLNFMLTGGMAACHFALTWLSGKGL